MMRATVSNVLFWPMRELVIAAGREQRERNLFVSGESPRVECREDRRRRIRRAYSPARRIVAATSSQDISLRFNAFPPEHPAPRPYWETISWIGTGRSGKAELP